MMTPYIGKPSRLLRLFSLLGLLAVCCVILFDPGPRRAGGQDADAGAAFPPFPLPPAEPSGPPQPPRLAVLVVFDQLRGDYLTRWQDLFSRGGFRRLQEGGAWFQNCHYPYAFTVTGAGHASLLTGCSPNTHGITGNEWYDRAAGKAVSCAAQERYQRVPPPPPAPPKKDKDRKKFGNGSPERLLAPSLGDVLKEATGGEGRVVSLSLKDRSAVLPGGRQPDACYWWDTADGLFVTSNYYRDSLHPWVAELDRTRPADRWFDRTWERLLPGVDYTRASGPDDVVGEGKGKAQGRTFPHPLHGGLWRPGEDYYEALFNSPFGNDLLLELVKRAIDREELGRHTVPDLLCISFSSNDAVGHTWGPDSQEVMDVTLRSDRIMQRLLDYLDDHVGRGRYLLALSADHGVCPLPEVSRRQGKDAGRINLKVLQQNVGAALNSAFGPDPDKAPWFRIESMGFYLDGDVLRRRGLKQPAVERVLAEALKQEPGIQTAWTRTELLRGMPKDDVGRAVWRSFHPQRSGDVLPVLKPYYLPGEPLGTGTTHGTPHAYDTHVPLLVYGPGVRPGVRQGAVTPQAVAAILAHGLGISAPDRAEAPLPDDLFDPLP
jgi:predicted AlkP superfamily pyrophosphatase or phosphodiesterase